MIFKDPCKLYVMVADVGGADRYFKIGIARDLSSRLSAVQTGCPMPITQVLSVELPGRAAALRAEKKMHAGLEPYRTSGEWFKFDMGNPAQKADFNEVARSVLDEPMGRGWKWDVASVAKYRKEREEVSAEDRADYRTRVLAHTIRLATGKRMW